MDRSGSPWSDPPSSAASSPAATRNLSDSFDEGAGSDGANAEAETVLRLHLLADVTNPTEQPSFAIGTNANPIMGQTSKLKLNKWGYIAADDSLATSVAGVFAGGDIVTGPNTVVDAIAAVHVDWETEAVAIRTRGAVADLDARTGEQLVGIAPGQLAVAVEAREAVAGADPDVALAVAVHGGDDVARDAHLAPRAREAEIRPRRRSPSRHRSASSCPRSRSSGRSRGPRH